jgi:hypothetical protein
MNDTPTSDDHDREEDDMLPEYDFDYRNVHVDWVGTPPHEIGPIRASTLV